MAYGVSLLISPHLCHAGIVETENYESEVTPNGGGGGGGVVQIVTKAVQNVPRFFIIQ
jgi:hypothetical protein